MSKLYPPIIEGIIPAFYANDDGTANLVVPFSMNPTVSWNEVGNIRLQLKTVQNLNTRLVDTGYYTDYFQKDKIIFSFTEQAVKENLNIGQHYKVQIAYQDIDGDVGYYSTVGVTKFTTKPTIYIEKLNEGIKNYHQYTYIGVYQNINDKTEKVYSYEFNLYNENDNLIKTSGELIHDNTQNTQLGSSEDKFDIMNDLEEDKIYYLQYKVTTINGLIEYSPKYKIIQKQSINVDIQGKLTAEVDNENGCVRLFINTDNSVIGDFSILRSSIKDNFTEWHELYKFRLQSQLTHKLEWIDFNVEHGVEYKYALQQFNSHGIKSNKQFSVNIIPYLEHSYLYDGERQLKIKFNPKVSSFKDILLEQKINTIGGKYPFIFRNGNVYYKEFPISGLISYQTDEDFFFIKQQEEYNPVTNLTYENINNEKDFKLEVLKWLNNGKPKLFKSATEGNYIVRLMNASLSPTDQLGRMLHTFSTTASEIADYTYDNLLKYNIARIKNPIYQNLNWKTIDITTGLREDYTVNFNEKEMLSLLIEDGTPEDLILIINGQNYGDANPNNNTYVDSDSNEIEEEIDDGLDDSHENTWVEGVGTNNYGFIAQLDKNGKYYIDLKNNNKITAVRFIDKSIQHKGLLTYAYNNIEKSNFDSIIDYSLESFSNSYENQTYDIISEIENENTTIQKINYIYATVTSSSRDTTLNFDGRIIDVKDIGEYKMYDFDRVNSLICGDGLRVDIMCDIQKVVYEGGENNESST